MKGVAFLLTKIGAITVGQAPRVDVTADILPLFGPCELLERGGLDGLTRADIAAFAPQEGDYVLVSRLVDGTSVTFAEKHVLPRLQDAIDELEAQGCRLIMFFCTGDFPDTFHSRVPLIFPNQILQGLVPALTTSGKIAVVTPSPLQLGQSKNKWEKYVDQATPVAASPYGDIEGIHAAARDVAAIDCDLVVLDCIGYTVEMKHIFAQATGKNIVLSRTLLARVVAELIH